MLECSPLALKRCGQRSETELMNDGLRSLVVSLEYDCLGLSE